MVWALPQAYRRGVALAVDSDGFETDRSISVHERSLAGGIAVIVIGQEVVRLPDRGVSGRLKIGRIDAVATPAIVVVKINVQ